MKVEVEARNLAEALEAVSERRAMLLSNVCPDYAVSLDSFIRRRLLAVTSSCLTTTRP